MHTAVGWHGVSFAAVLAVAVTSAVALGDEVTLLSGICVQGTVVRGTRQDVTIRLATGREVSYAWNDVHSVREDPVTSISTGDLRDAAAAGQAYLRAADEVDEPWAKARACMRAVQCLQRAGKPREALAAFFRLAETQPDSIRLIETPLFGAAEAEAALSALENLAPTLRNPAPMSLLPLVRADLLVALTRLDEAERLLKDMRGDLSADLTPLVQMRLGGVMVARGRVEDGLEAMRQAAALSPLPAAFGALWRAEALRRSGSTDQALVLALTVSIRYPFLEDRAARCLALVGEARTQQLRLTEAGRAWRWLQRRYPFSVAALRVPSGFRLRESAEAASAEVLAAPEAEGTTMPSRPEPKGNGAPAQPHEH